MRKMAMCLAGLFLISLIGGILPTTAISAEKDKRELTIVIYEQLKVKFVVPDDPKATGTFVKIVVVKSNGEVYTGFNETVKLYVSKENLEDGSSCNSAPFDVQIKNGQAEFEIWGKQHKRSIITLKVESSLGTFSSEPFKVE